MEYTAIIEQTSDGWYIAQCEQVPGALTQGRTLDEVRENLKEAIFLCWKPKKNLALQDKIGCFWLGQPFFLKQKYFF